LQQVEAIKEKEVDLATSLHSLRVRKANLKRHALPVRWEKGESIPLNISLQIHWHSIFDASDTTAETDDS